MFQNWAAHVIKTYNSGEITLSKDGASATYLHPGLSYRHIDREDNPEIKDVMMFLNEARNISVFTYFGPNSLNHLDFLDLMDRGMIFVTSTVIEMRKEFYKEVVPKWPLKITNSLGHIGNSSLTINVKATTQDGSTLLMNQTSCYVIVSRLTRKSMLLPSDFKEKYKNSVVSGPCRVETLTKPKETFHFKTVVLWTDTDHNNHANYSTFVNLAINTIRMALRLQTKHQHRENRSRTEEMIDIRFPENYKPSDIDISMQTEIGQNSSKSIEGYQQDDNKVLGLRGLNKEIVRSGLKSVKLCFVKESIEGDELDVYVWQEEDEMGGVGAGESDRCVKAIVEREGESLCHIHLEYFGCTVAASNSHL